MRCAAVLVLLALLACREKQKPTPAPPTPAPAPSAGTAIRVNSCGDGPCEIVRGEPMRIGTDGKSLFYAGSYAFQRYVLIEVAAASAEGRVLATTDAEPSAMVADSDALYWTYAGKMGGGYVDGTVNRLDRKTGAATVLAGDLSYPSAIAVDDTNVYWVSTGDRNPGVFRVTKTGGAAERLAKARPSSSIAVTKTHVYYHGRYVEDGTYRVAKKGGEPKEITKDHVELVFDGDTLYGMILRGWLDGELVRVEPDGKIVSLGKLGLESSAGKLAVDDRRVYVASEGSRRVLAVPKTGGKLEPFVSGAGPADSVVIAGAYLFWSTGSQIGRIRR